jgi:hypothetical protein
MAARKIDRAQAAEEIISRLDILAEYRQLGVEFVASTPRASGMIECFARGREEKKASAAVSVKTGRYIDKGSGESLSFFDFAAKYGNGRFKDWQEARKHYAELTGVKLTGGRPPEDPHEKFEFLPWDTGHERLATRWGAIHKKGISLEALKLCGARIARWPRYFDKKTETWKTGEFKVVALPCYGERLLEADPVAWVIWNLAGGVLRLYRGKNVPPDESKMLSFGPTAGTLMGFHALARLADPGDVPIELLLKTGGPTDMLAAVTAILRDAPDLVDRHLVLTNASGETGDVLPHQAAVFAGYPVCICHDADEAGEIGAVKWVAALTGVASELRRVKLPWPVEKKAGKDLRDFFNGVPAGETCQPAESEVAA